MAKDLEEIFKDKGPARKSEPKPASVGIVSANTVATVGQFGVSLYIIGLGDDGLMYRWVGASKSWELQR